MFLKKNQVFVKNSYSVFRLEQFVFFTDFLVSLAWLQNLSSLPITDITAMNQSLSLVVALSLVLALINFKTVPNRVQHFLQICMKQI